MDTQLLVSLSGISPRTLDRCAELAAELDRRKVPLTILHPPRTENSPATDWVRDRRLRGDGLLMHGYDHRITPTHRTVQLGRKAEFAALPAHEARLRLIAATAALEGSGLKADGFAPPRWLASRGTLAALAERGFTLCAELAAVHHLGTGEVVHRAKVLEFTAGHQRAETVRCFALVLAAARAARRGGLVRLGVDAAELAGPGLRQAFLDAVDVALEHRARAVTYGALRTSSSPRAAAL
ncbi:DUF2334 domain-containing protein [Amycolatopsis nigrescens]|uniref:DUF2334 domain-containing protein n=1 Tax=Amycolatopsis nigrescens TaxID=381445 RepID=UPI0003770F2E|nr:DUF2334 domain-containing protein [Amycolatopsis nigrescens]